MNSTKCYSITTKCFSLRCRQDEWLCITQTLYNEMLQFYYTLFLENRNLHSQNRQEILRSLEKLTIAGRNKLPVPFPLPWQKVPLYFRRAVINAAIGAGKSFLNRKKQLNQTVMFHKTVTFYKGMYRLLTEKSIELKVWNGDRWQWIHCRLLGNTLPQDAEYLSPSVVIRQKRIQLHIPVKEVVSDGRSAKERLLSDTVVCSIQFTNDDSFAVCVFLDCQRNLESTYL